MTSPIFYGNMLLPLASLSANSGTGDASDWRGKGSGVFADTASSGSYLARLGLGAYAVANKADFAKLAKAKRVGDKLQHLSLPIIHAGLDAIIVLEQTNGWGRPEEGESFRASFTPPQHTLAAADPDDSWQGSGSEAYRSANHTQLTNAEKMATADAALHAILHTEASQVEDTRLVLASMKNFLVFVCIPTAIALKISSGEHASIIFQIAAVTAALGGCEAAQSTMIARSTQHAFDVRSLINDYQEVRAAAKPNATPLAFSNGPGRPSAHSVSDSVAPTPTRGDRAAAGAAAPPASTQTQPAPTQLRPPTIKPPSLTAQISASHPGADFSTATTAGPLYPQGSPARTGHVGTTINPGTTSSKRGAVPTQHDLAPAPDPEQELKGTSINAAAAAAGTDDAERIPVAVARAHPERAQQAVDTRD